jgi:hypothetical protein
VLNVVYFSHCMSRLTAEYVRNSHLFTVFILNVPCLWKAIFCIVLYKPISLMVKGSNLGQGRVNPGTLMMHCKLVNLFLLGIWDQMFISQTKQGFVLFGHV